MSMITSNARVAVTRVNGGLSTEHYATVFEMLEQILCESGERAFKDFLTLALPRIIQRWKRGREYEVIMDADTGRLLHDYELLSGCEMIANERARQINREGWTSEHDDEHVGQPLAMAAACYALQAAGAADPSLTWPFDAEWWKPTTAMRDLVKAGALVAAEIDRLQRIEARKEQTKESAE